MSSSSWRLHLPQMVSCVARFPLCWRLEARAAAALPPSCSRRRRHHRRRCARLHIAGRCCHAYLKHIHAAPTATTAEHTATALGPPSPPPPSRHHQAPRSCPRRLCPPDNPNYHTANTPPPPCRRHRNTTCISTLGPPFRVPTPRCSGKPPGRWLAAPSLTCPTQARLLHCDLRGERAASGPSAPLSP